MFSLTTVDLVRLDSDHAARNYTIHARAAERLATAAFVGRVIIVTLLATATAAAVVGLLLPSRNAQIATVASVAAALVAFAIYAVLGLESRVGAHRQLAHRLWIVAERYRALLVEMNEGGLDSGAVMRRREDLIHELHAIYEGGFAADQSARESARLPPLPFDEAA